MHLDRDIRKEEPNGGKCLLCENPATGAWYGRTYVYFCKPCALDCLPKLIFDACFSSERVFSLEDLERDLAIVRAAYYRAGISAACEFAKGTKEDLADARAQNEKSLKVVFGK